MQIAAMNIDVRAAEALLAGGIELELVKRLARIPGAADERVRADPRFSRRRSIPIRRSTFITLALRMMPAPIREKAGACS
jgi:hypothetical protein